MLRVELGKINRVLRRAGLVLVVMTGKDTPTTLWIERAATYDRRAAASAGEADSEPSKAPAESGKIDVGRAYATVYIVSEALSLEQLAERIAALLEQRGVSG